MGAYQNRRQELFLRNAPTGFKYVWKLIKTSETDGGHWNVVERFRADILQTDGGSHDFRHIGKADVVQKVTFWPGTRNLTKPMPNRCPPDAPWPDLASRGRFGVPTDTPQ